LQAYYAHLGVLIWVRWILTEHREENKDVLIDIDPCRIDTGIIGPVTVMSSYHSKFGSLSSTVHGLIVSSILIPAAISSFFAGRVADLLGRPKGIGIGALIFGIGAAMEASAVHLAMFIVGRCIEGIGEGLYLGNLVVYVCLYLHHGQTY
jgi:MFS family permease